MDARDAQTNGVRKKGFLRPKVVLMVLAALLVVGAGAGAILLQASKKSGCAGW